MTGGGASRKPEHELGSGRPSPAPGPKVPADPFKRGGPRNAPGGEAGKGQAAPRTGVVQTVEGATGTETYPRKTGSLDLAEVRARALAFGVDALATEECSALALRRGRGRRRPRVGRAAAGAVRLAARTAGGVRRSAGARGAGGCRARPVGRSTSRQGPLSGSRWTAGARSRTGSSLKGRSDQCPGRRSGHAAILDDVDVVGVQLVRLVGSPVG